MATSGLFIGVIAIVGIIAILGIAGIVGIIVTASKTNKKQSVGDNNGNTSEEAKNSKQE